ncbi:MAG TPA: hypothetical protein ENF80_05355 [Thermofilum sp.]|nr:hypothetical protein [Thermofilum sp.]
MSSVSELANGRVSVRTYAKEPIGLNDVIYAVNVASQAPSGANTQPWRFIVITDEKLKVELKLKRLVINRILKS